MVIHTCGFVQEMAMTARPGVSDLLGVDLGSCEPPKLGTGKCRVMTQELVFTSPTLTDAPPPTFPPFLPLTHMPTCPASCCMLRKTGKQTPSPSVAIPLWTSYCLAPPIFGHYGHNPYLFYSVSSEKQLTLYLQPGSPDVHSLLWLRTLFSDLQYVYVLSECEQSHFWKCFHISRTEEQVFLLVHFSSVNVHRFLTLPPDKFC